MSARRRASPAHHPARAASANRRVRVLPTVAVLPIAVLPIAVLAVGLAFGSARAQDGSTGGLPAVAAGHLDAQMADLGTPAFVDGLAGLLLAHAGRNPDRAGAIGRTVLARAPGADGEVAEALRLAGFDPAVAGLDGAAAGRRVPVGDDVTGAAATDGISAQPGMAPAGPGDVGGRLGGVSLNLSAGQTARPGLADLATPQLR
jgi:hypothetical protein